MKKEGIKEIVFYGVILVIVIILIICNNVFWKLGKQKEDVNNNNTTNKQQVQYLQENNRENLVKLSTDIDDYVRRVFRKVIAVENLNYNNTSEEKARVRKYFSDLAKTVYPE